ncbi:OadG family protein [Stutzerimonas frequens]|jgi:oxaloacetate decarboxylase (Na+ extruding) subunit gamma|uniref:Probable oxaloacetate decarboxylase gamma chain n=1 Tax=Stutzerimonas frequens TaxID=2968969 RepID=A0AA47E4J8_9GAMM|nr:OadG family transporter subunit [Stutzerimonas frequens]NCT78980.1 oxaloacetate decarboxylase [Stutzerimonas stutzeri]AWT10956.1 oxaloacetate decarboxylase [Stutzerimonas frequens]MBK3757960.1 oxaloacetate decarboxylase [Stutzerimonas frequens]MBK3872301.1 oxaloacetate decarboxylase [Stutzerimonas frequens]MBK3910832.1 oxaloacetate decarboxylase [Stutzerimonas frequens]
MTPSQLLLEGVELMLFGIGFVFAFLVLLILCIRLMSYLTGRFVSAPEPQLAAAPVTSADADTLAAIKAAIHQHRARRG